MKRIGVISLLVAVAILIGAASGCINVLPLKGNAINPYVQWFLLDSTDLTPLVDEVATRVAQEGLTPSQ